MSSSSPNWYDHFRGHLLFWEVALHLVQLESKPRSKRTLFVQLLSLVFLLTLVTPVQVFPQEFRATISGSVTDQTGAAVPGAKITAVEIRTGVKTPTVTDQTGHYTIPFLLPGSYQLNAEAKGFKPFVRKGLTLTSEVHAQIDIALQIGSASETVTVTDEVPILNTTDATIGQSISTKEVEDIPLNGRTPAMLAALSIGVIATSTTGVTHPFDNNAQGAWSIGGSPSQSSEILMDGSPNTIWSGAASYSPPQDAVQEVTVKPFDTDAGFGHTFGGVVNMVLKQGTNNFHGSVYEYTQPTNLTANDWFANSVGRKEPPAHFNQYGLTAGGPVLVPKIVNGKDKLFWFFAYEGLKDSSPATMTTTVPTAAERLGDFSALLAVDPVKYQLYDPSSGVSVGGKTVRTPILNNDLRNLPGWTMNPIAKALLNFYPEPNAAGKADGVGNYVGSAPSSDGFDNELGRLDWVMTERSKLFFDIRHNYRNQVKENYFNNAATGVTAARTNWGATVDEVYTLNDSTILDVRASWQHFGETHGSPGIGFDPAQLGLPAYLAANSTHVAFPAITWFGSCGSSTSTADSFTCLGSSADSIAPSDSQQLFADVSKSRGKHTLKFGADLRKYIVGYTAYGSSSGSFKFDSTYIKAASNSAEMPAVVDLAALELGVPSSGQYDINTTETLHTYNLGWFLQDDWRIKNNLTLNLGIRYDLNTPYVEKLNRTVNGFDTSTANPVATAAQTAYTAAIIASSPLLPATLAVPGGLTYGPDGKLFKVTSHLPSPRFGFSWSPEKQHKTVIRGGFGLFEAPVAISRLSSNGKYSSTPQAFQEGYSQTTSFVSSSTGVNPTGTLSDPFPSGILPPVDNSLGLSTFLGQNISFFAPTVQNPYSIRWNFGFQRQLARDLMFEVDYVGNHSVHLPVWDTELNNIPNQYLNTATVSTDPTIKATNDALTKKVTNPFAGLLPGTSLNSSTIAVSNLLKPYPEFGNVQMVNATNGSSKFEALDAQLVKRFSHGLSLKVVYQFSKQQEAVNYLNVADTSLESRVGMFDHPQHFVTAASYDLPVGRGKLLNVENRWLNGIVGNWRVTGVYTFQTGAPVFLTNDMYWTGGPITSDPRNIDAAIVSSALDLSTKTQSHLRSLPTTLSSVRSDGLNNFDASLAKNIKFNEDMRLELRAEAFNTLNHPAFGLPNVSVSQTSFGTIGSTVGQPRILQLGARFVF